MGAEAKQNLAQVRQAHALAGMIALARRWASAAGRRGE